MQTWAIFPSLEWVGKSQASSHKGEKGEELHLDLDDAKRVSARFDNEVS